MKRKYLGLISLLYVCIIIYTILTDTLKNYLAPQLQLYIKISLLPLFIIGVILLFGKGKKQRFKKSDLILLLPLILLLLASDGRLTSSFASNKIINATKMVNKDITDKKDEVTIKAQEEKETEDLEKAEKKEIKNEPKEVIEEEPKETEETIDFKNVYFDVKDSTYNDLEDYLSFVEYAKNYEGKTIRLRGFTILKEAYIPNGYFAIGKYSITCCAADAGFIPFLAKYDLSKIKNETWYEIEGILESMPKNEYGIVMGIRVINIKEIDGKNEEQYVYPCYSYDNGLCSDIEKYHLIYDE